MGLIGREAHRRLKQYGYNDPVKRQKTSRIIQFLLLFAEPLITRHARFRPHHTAVVFEDNRLSYHEFNRRVDRPSNALLDIGVGKGAKVTAILPKCL